MSKHKKTRKEKIIADYRHQIYILKDDNMPTYTPAPAIAINENRYFNDHILKDVIKTGILTCFIVIAQFVLLFLLKRHIIALPMINY
jgi:hypothetical protein